MSLKQPTAKITADEKSCKVIKNYVELNDLEDICAFEISKNLQVITITHETEQDHFERPFRLGKILDRLIYYQNKSSQGPEIIAFNNGVLNTHSGIFTKNKGPSLDICLTEKEVEILTYLNEHKGKIVSREKLLSAVWNYAETVETHTVETHIYRLRQKIETDPANPQIVIKKDDGYIIKNKSGRNQPC